MNSQDPNYCNTCKKDFVYRIDLKNHIKVEHKTYKPCRNLGACTYSPCRYNHKEYPKDSQVCFECGMDFKTIHDLMRHRKINHKTVLCKMFLKNKCDYSGEGCYFTHAKEPQGPPAKVVERPSEKA